MLAFRIFWDISPSSEPAAGAGSPLRRQENDAVASKKDKEQDTRETARITGDALESTRAPLPKERRASLLTYYRDEETMHSLRRGKPVTLGRGAPATAVIPDPALSREHALIVFTGDKVTIEDRGSTNGTFVNGRQIEEKTPTL